MIDEEIAQLYREMELELIASAKRNLTRHLKEEDKIGFQFTQWQSETLKELERFKRENKSIIKSHTNGLDKEIEKILQDELKKGNQKEFSKYKEIMGNRYKQNDNLRNSFFRLNDQKIKSLIKTINNDLDSANKACFRMINDQYRKTIVKAVMFSNHGVMSPKKAIDMATQEFLSAGINCIEYKNGRRVNIASYAKMAVRTANSRAQLIGEGQFRQEIGKHLVKVTAHGGTCELCSKWEGKVLIDDVFSGGSKEDGNYQFLSYAMENGLFHPSCRHGLPTWYKESKQIDFDENGPTEETMKQYQEDLNYINQNIYKYQRLETGSLDKENIQKYSQKKKEWENIKRRLITLEERNAIEKYTGIDSQIINRAIRTEKINNEIKEKISLLDSAISKAPELKEDTFVYRGTIPQSFEIFAEHTKVSAEEIMGLKGTVQCDLAFMSTSSKKPETIGRTLIMTIKLPKGYKGALPIKKYAHPKFKYQEEILLKRGNKFIVNDVKIKDNKYYLEVEMKT